MKTDGARLLSAWAALLWLPLCLPASLPAQPLHPEAGTAAAQRAVLDKYCVVCHNQRAKTAGLILDQADLNNAYGSAELWEKVVRRLRAGTMPPLGMPRPDQATSDSLTSYLESTLDKAASLHPNPGRATLHRLNRSEYARAIRDLLALDVDVNSLLPPDDESYGFDNIADVLGVSPLLLERYLSASRKISRLAVGDTRITPVDVTYPVRPDLSQHDHIDGLPLGTRGGTLIHYNFPVDGEYAIKIKLVRNTVAIIRGLEEPHQIEVTVDGARVFLDTVGTPADLELVKKNPADAGEAIEGRLQPHVSVKAGPRDIGVAFLKKSSAEPDLLLQPFVRSNLDPVDDTGRPEVLTVVVGGPFKIAGSGDTPSRRRIFTCRPANPGEELPCARKIISTLARKAYRRPVNDNDLESLLGFYQRGRNEGSFETGIEKALRLMLGSPEFVFRFEPDPPNLAANSVYRVSDLALASRLSFFLWSSLPDDELLAAVKQGKLKDPVVLERQVKRMLADSRSHALVDNFAGQWLYLRNLKSVAPDVEEFPDFDDNLRQAMKRETELFFESIVSEDHNVLDLMTANYTFINERLARHYGIPNVYGTRFRRVVLDDDARRGLLGKGSILTVTSYATRTSPVLRGKWILTNILGTPTPPPPPNVPALKENSEGGKPLSVRERMELHRSNAACAVCHKVMDPLGFSLEYFDGVGKWRTTSEAGTKIDASGVLADGSKVDDPVTLRQALLKHPEGFVRTFTEKLLTYALGRGVEYYDMPAVRAIVRDAAREDCRFSSIVLGIVKSTPFQMKMKMSQEGEGSLVANARH